MPLTFEFCMIAKANKGKQMKIKNSIKLITLSVVASLLVGCGGGSDDTTTPPADVTTSTGIFVDAPVQGLSYKTATQSGFTNESGEFKYVDGEEVEFKVGNLLLGKAQGGALVTPYTITDNNDTATNIALLLQNFDNDRGDAILNIAALKDYNLSDFNISDTNENLESKLTTLLATGDFQRLRGGSNFDLLGATAVKSAMDSYIVAKEELLSREELIEKSLNNIGRVSFFKNNQYVESAYRGGFTSSAFTTTEDGSSTVNIPYSIMDGYLKVKWSSYNNDPDEYHSILSLNQEYIYGCTASSLEEVKECVTPSYRIQY